MSMHKDDYLALFVHYNFSADFPIMEALTVASRRPSSIVRDFLLFVKRRLATKYRVTLHNTRDCYIDLLISLRDNEWHMNIHQEKGFCSFSIIYEDSKITIRSWTAYSVIEDSFKYNNCYPYSIGENENLSVHTLINRLYKVMKRAKWKEVLKSVNLTVR